MSLQTTTAFNGPPPPPGFGTDHPAIEDIVPPQALVDPPTITPATPLDPAITHLPPAQTLPPRVPSVTASSGITGVLTFKHVAPKKPVAVAEAIISSTSEVEGDAWDGNYFVDESPSPPAPSAWNTAGACATDLGGGYTLNDLIRDINGSSGFSSHRAAVGTVPSSYYLQVTPGMTIPDKIIIGRDPFRSPDVDLGSEEYQKRIMSFLVANRDAMMAGVQGLTPEHASFLALLRLNFALAGGLVSVLSERAIYVNEYTVSNVTWTPAMRFQADKLLVEYIAETWLQYVGVLRHLFVTRGHHYKAEYGTMITRIWATTTISAPPGLSVPSWENIMRLGLHCFGIRAVNLLVTDAYYKGSLAASLATRFFAAPAGTAPVITAMAGVNAMKKASWWSTFLASYGPQVADLTALHTKVKELGLRAHVNAKLFNWAWTSYKLDTTAVDALAPLILAFIDNLDREESLRGQECLKKRGDGGSAIRRYFSTSLANEDKNARHLESPEQFFGMGGQSRT